MKIARNRELRKINLSQLNYATEIVNNYITENAPISKFPLQNSNLSLDLDGKYPSIHGILGR